jgi:hypothetical protein
VTFGLQVSSRLSVGYMVCKQLKRVYRVFDDSTHTSTSAGSSSASVLVSSPKRSGDDDFVVSRYSHRFPISFVEFLGHNQSRCSSCRQVYVHLFVCSCDMWRS